MKLKKNTRNARAARRRTAELQSARKRNTRLRRQHNRRRDDEIATQAFQRHNWEQVYQLPEAWFHLQPICQKAPLLLDPDFGKTLQYIYFKRRHWLDSVEAWQPRGKTPRQQLISLFEHLMVRYPVPVFLYEPFLRPRWNYKHMDLFLSLTRGGSLVKFVKKTNYPIPLTKRMCHEFLTSPHAQFRTALRTAQVKGHRGGEALGLALCGTWIGGELCCTRHERKRDLAIQWLCRNPEFPLEQLGILSDWIQSKGEDLTWDGRTVASVLRHARVWQENLRRREVRETERRLRELARNEEELNTPFPKSGLRPLRRRDWSIEEIRTPLELLDEGETMGHCVGGYVNRVLGGECSIWSFSRRGKKVLTIQTDGVSVNEALGYRNRDPDQTESTIILKWAKWNKLKNH